MKSSQSLEKKYATTLLGHNLKWVGEVGRCRCPVCGDSKKNDRKARFYVYPKRKDLYYFSVKCHNCGIAQSFPFFLKERNVNLYNEYRLECMRGEISPFHEKKNPFQNKLELLELSNITELQPQHVARQYIAARLIPDKRWNDIFFTDNFSKFVLTDFLKDAETLPSYLDKTLPTDSRVVFPYRTRDRKIFTLQGRSLANNSSLRYITVRRDEATPKIFGLDRHKKDEVTFITEGPIDSLFLPNCLAMGGAGINNDTLSYSEVDRTKTIVIYDNEKRNKAIIHHMESAIELGLSVVVWKDVPSELKDINQLVMTGLAKKDLLFMISQRVFSGLRATLELNNWKKT